MLDSDPDRVPSDHRRLWSVQQEDGDPEQRCPPETRPSRETETGTAAAAGGAEAPAVRPWREVRSLLQSALQHQPNFTQQQKDVSFREFFRDALEASLDAYSRSRARSARPPPCGSWEYDGDLNVDPVKTETPSCGPREYGVDLNVDPVKTETPSCGSREYGVDLNMDPEKQETPPCGSREYDENTEVPETSPRPPPKEGQRRRVQKPCGQTCRTKCWDRISGARREALHAAYWDMSYEDKKAFVSSSLTLQQAGRSGDAAPGRRRNLLAYHFTDDRGLRQRVCKIFFLTTLGYHRHNDWMVHVVTRSRPHKRRCRKTAGAQGAQAGQVAQGVQEVQVAQGVQEVQEVQVAQGAQAGQVAQGVQEVQVAQGTLGVQVAQRAQEEIAVELHQLEAGDTERWNVTQYIYFM